MMKKYLMTIFLAVTLSSCADSGSEEGIDQSGQSFIRHAVERILGVFNSKPSDEEKAERNAKSPVKPVQASQSSGAVQNHLSQVMGNLQTEPQIRDQKIQKNALEEYRRDFTQSANLADKVEALAALVQVDRKNAVPLLKSAYASREPELRKEAVLQMHAFNDKKEIVDLLLKALEDTDADVVMEAVEGLAGLENKRVIKMLKKVAISHPDKLVREVAQDYVEQVQNGN